MPGKRKVETPLPKSDASDGRKRRVGKQAAQPAAKKIKAEMPSEATERFDGLIGV